MVFFQERLDFQYLTTLPLQNLLTELSHLPPQTLVFYTTVFRDGAGETLVPREIAQRVSAAANAPTYGFFEQYVGQGIIGGKVNSLSAHGVEAGKLASEMLAGTATSRPQVDEMPTNKLLFDWRQLQRWRISESKLPAGSEIRFRESNAWEQYQPQILAIAAAILVQATLIGWLIHERQYRRRAERSARETFSELTQMNRMATRALSSHCPRDQTTYHRHGNDGQCRVAVAFKRRTRYWPGPGCNEQGCGGRASGK